MSIWEFDKPTEKQLQAIWNMEYALSIKDSPAPTSKGEACTRISALKAIIQKNIQITGAINPGSLYAIEDSDEDYFDPVY